MEASLLEEMVDVLTEEGGVDLTPRQPLDGSITADVAILGELTHRFGNQYVGLSQGHLVWFLSGPRYLQHVGGGDSGVAQRPWRRAD